MADQPTQGQKIAAGGGYGDRKNMEQLQGSAPMAGTPAPPSPPPLTAAMLPHIASPSGRPEEPVTAGANLGPGPSAVDAGILTDKQQTDAQLRPYLRSMQLLANLPGSNPEFRSAIRLMKARFASE